MDETKKLVKWQGRLSNTLKTHRNLKNISRKDAAAILQIHPQKYAELENEKNPYGKLATSMGFLSKLANFLHVPLGEFISILEGSSSRISSAGTLKRQLYLWESAILKQMDGLEIDTRDNFISALSEFSKEDFNKISLIVNILKKKEPTYLDGLLTILNN